MSQSTLDNQIFFDTAVYRFAVNVGSSSGQVDINVVPGAPGTGTCP
jgi:hypothetical protein